MRQIILDTETTGLSSAQGHRIIEIAGIELENRRFTGRQFHQYLNPEREIDEGAQKVHGLTQEFLADKPIFLAVVDEFIEFISGAELVIHNAPFDISFLDYEFKLTRKKLGPTEKYCQVLDTLTLARQLHPGQRNSLDALCKRYDVDNSDRNLHGALIDADLLALVYLAMTSGQENLFVEEHKNLNKTVHTVTANIKPIAGEFKVIRASEAELVEHQTQLTRLGVEVW